MINRIVCVCAGLLLTGCNVVSAKASVTGHLLVTLTDRETGEPITNALVTVTVDKTTSPSWHASPVYERTSAPADTNGVAHVIFQYYGALGFDWKVVAPGHYNGRFGSGHGHEKFGCVVEESDYLNIDTNTVQGLAMYNELLQLDANNDYLGFAAKFEPKSVTYTNNVICRSVCLTPKHNPQPMYAYARGNGVRLPKKNPAAFVTNGLDVVGYDPVDFDLKECLVVSSNPEYDPLLHGSSGKTSDFRIERYRFTTNNVTTTCGWIDFAPGCGAYKRNTTGDPSFPTTYEADTNETFVSRIPFEYSSVSGRVVNVQNILGENEYMVLRTRVSTNEVGEVTSCNYSKILGPMSIEGRMYFTSLVFNPTPNDSKVEFDTVNNLATDDPCNWYP